MNVTISVDGIPFSIEDVFSTVYRFIYFHTDWKEQAEKVIGDEAVDFMVEAVQRFHGMQSQEKNRKPICLTI